MPTFYSICPGCHNLFSNLTNHLHQSPDCQNHIPAGVGYKNNLSPTASSEVGAPHIPPIPTDITLQRNYTALNTSTTDSAEFAGDGHQDVSIGGIASPNATSLNSTNKASSYAGVHTRSYAATARSRKQAATTTSNSSFEPISFPADSLGTPVSKYLCGDGISWEEEYRLATNFDDHSMTSSAGNRRNMAQASLFLQSSNSDFEETSFDEDFPDEKPGDHHSTAHALPAAATICGISEHANLEPGTKNELLPPSFTGGGIFGSRPEHCSVFQDHVLMTALLEDDSNPGVASPEDGLLDDELPQEQISAIKCPVNSTYFRRLFTHSERLLLRLADLFDFANVPLYVQDEVIKIVQEEMSSCLSSDTYNQLTGREAFFKHLQKRFPTPGHTTTIIPLESHGPYHSVSVVHYSFQQMVSDLLSDVNLFGDIDNLVVNSNDPFSSPPWRLDGQLDELVDGAWYKRTWHQVHSLLGPNPEPFVVLAVICYCDKTGTDMYQRYGLEPFLFTLSCLKRSARYRPESWRPLGFLPNLEKSSSAANKVASSTQAGRGRNIRNYHHCLRTILQSFIDCQGFHKPRYAYVRFGDTVKYVRVFFPLGPVLGDGKSGDTMCGRYGSYNREIKRLSRGCDVSGVNAGNPEHVCQWLSLQPLQDISVRGLKLVGIIPWEDNDTRPQSRPEQAKEFSHIYHTLKSHSHYMHDNAFADVWFGDNERGILGATPTDLMHAFLHGIVSYVINVILAEWTPTELNALDEIVDKIIRPVRSSARTDYPRCDFSKGISNLTMVTADEWAGVAFTIALIIHNGNGYQLFKKVRERLLSKDATDKAKREEDICHWKACQAKLKKRRRSSASNVAEPDKGSMGVVNNKKCPPPWVDPIRPEPLEQLNLLETLLCFHAWYKRGSPYNLLDTDMRNEYLKSVRAMLTLILQVSPRMEGNGWAIQKFHDILHVVFDMYEYGSPQNYDCGPGEHNLIPFAKDPAKNARKGQDCFLTQVNKRLRETITLRKAMTYFPGHENTLRFQKTIEARRKKLDAEERECRDSMLGPTSELYGRCKYIIKADPRAGSNRLMCQWVASMQGVIGHRNVHPVVIRHFHKLYNDGYFAKDDIIECWTEYKRDGSIYRAHPNFNSVGEWYDWALFLFEPANPMHTTFPKSMYPSKILCFYRIQGDDPLKIFAVIHTCLTRNDATEDSLLFERWYPEYGTSSRRPILHSVSVDSMGIKVLAFPDMPGTLEVLPQQYRDTPGLTVVTPRCTTDDIPGWHIHF